MHYNHLYYLHSLVIKRGDFVTLTRQSGQHRGERKCVSVVENCRTTRFHNRASGLTEALHN